MRTFIHLLFTSIILFYSTHCIVAQDTLYMFHGNPINAMILKITPEEVRYKKYEDMGGKSYIVKAYDVFYISYKKGQRDTLRAVKPDFQADSLKKVNFIYPKIVRSLHGKISMDTGYLTESQLYNKLSNYKFPDLNTKIKIAKRAKAIQYTTFVLGVVTVPTELIWTALAGISSTGFLGSNPQSVSYYGPAVIGSIGVGCLTTSFVFRFKRTKRKRDIISFYNEKYYKQKSLIDLHQKIEAVHKSSFRMNDEYIGENEVYDQLSILNNEKISLQITQAKKCNRIRNKFIAGALIAIPCAISSAAFLTSYDPLNQHNLTPIPIGIGIAGVQSGICGLFFQIKKNIHKKKIASIFNETY